jgi:hypothetical protein
VSQHLRHSRRAPLEGAEAGSPYAARDACGVGFIARQSGERTHEVVQLALAAAARLAHRGAQGADLSADGAGLLTQIPRRLFILAASRQGIHLPADATVAVGMCFLPTDRDARALAERVVEEVLVGDGLPVLGWRDVPVEPALLGPSARAAMPAIRQVLVGRPCRSERRCLGAHPVSRAPRDRASRRRPRARAVLHLLALLPHDRVQGAADRRAAGGFLPRPARTVVRDGDRRVSRALRHQHDAALGAGAAVPHAGAQRRDQHAVGQPQRDGDARRPARRAHLRRQARARAQSDPQGR